MSFEPFDFNNKRNDEYNVDDIIITFDDELNNTDEFNKMVLDMWDYIKANKNEILVHKDNIINQFVVDNWFKDDPNPDEEAVILASFLANSLLYYTILETILKN